MNIVETVSVKSNSLKGGVKDMANKIDAYIYAICLLLLIPPYFVWHSELTFILLLICSVISLKNTKANDKKQTLFFIAFVFSFLYMFVMDGNNIFGIISKMFIVFIFLTPFEFIKQVFNKFVLLYSISLLPSLICFILVGYVGYNLPHSTLAPLNALKTVDYLLYPFFVMENDVFNMIVPRFSAYFDEPGVVGTISSVLLLCSGFNLRKKVNIPIFIAGLLSLSFAFYLVVLVYGIIFASKKIKIITILISIVLLFLFSKNEIINTLIFDRFKIEDGKIAGDDRTNPYFDEWYEKQFKETTNYYWGLGDNASITYNQGGSSYKNLIVDYGLIFFVFLMALFVFGAYSQLKFKKEFFVYLFILLLIVYQRPGVTRLFILFLIWAPLAVFSKPRQSKSISTVISDRIP